MQVYEKLSLAEIDACLPDFYLLRTWKDQKLVRFPLFSGHLFIHNEKDCRAILGRADLYRPE